MSVSGWIDIENMVYIHTVEYYSSIKKGEILTFVAEWLELGNHYVNWNKPGTKTNTTCSLSYVEVKKSGVRIVITGGTEDLGE